jgi:radical SAM-linked protein
MALAAREKGTRAMGTLRARFARGPEVSAWTHQDFVAAIRDAADRSGLPLARGSGGVPRIAAGPPLAQGYVSRCEYMDFEVSEPITSAAFGRGLAPLLPEGVELVWQRRIRSRSPHLRAAVTAYSYTVPGEFERARADAFARARVWPYRRIRAKKGNQEFDLKQSVSRLETRPDGLTLTIEVRPDGTPKPAEIVESVFGMPADQARRLQMERVGVRFLPVKRPRPLGTE